MKTIWIKFGNSYYPSDRLERSDGYWGFKQNLSVRPLRAVRRIQTVKLRWIYSLIFFIFSLFTLISCNNNDAEIKEFLNSGNEEMFENLDYKNEMFFSLFETVYIENPNKTKQYKQTFDSINYYYNILKGRRVLIVQNNKNNNQKNKNKAKKVKTNFIPIKEGILLTDDEIISYTKNLKSFLIKITSKDKKLSNQLIEILDFSNFENKKLTENEKILLNCKISNAVYITYEYLYKKIEQIRFEFNYFYPIVIPENYWVKPNEYFNAQLGFTFIDTIHNFTGIIENDSIYFKKSIAYYTFCPDSLGKYKKSGNVFLESPSTGELNTFPFNFEFKVIENE